ncbi:hypothetical protein JCM3775_000291 [Rhodotorula graminis]
MSGFLSSLGLSSYLHHHGPLAAVEQATEGVPDVPQDETHPATPPAASPALDSPAAQPSYTPDHRPTSRFSPNSLSTSSATMSGILSAHPHFSVFRKSASATSLDELAVAPRAASTSPEGAAGGGESARADFSMRDLLDGDDEVETLATPPNQSPAARKASPKGDRSGSSDASSFHLSLDSAEMHSLNFGDQSSLSLSPAVSPSSAAAVPGLATRTPVTASPAQTSGVRLVPDSPPTTRTPVPRSRSTSAQSTGKMRSSVGPVQRVQFSPISSCPSPLLSASTLPPPPPPPPPTFADPSSISGAGRADRWSPLDDAQSRACSGILKYPRTPGTGRSVRFTASVVERTPEPEGEVDGEGPTSEDSPSVAVGSRSAGRAARPHDVDVREEEDGEPGREAGRRADESVARAPDASAGEPSADDDSSVLVASFLSKLQAVIPSPDVSLVDSTTSLPLPPPASASAPAPAPAADLPLISVDPSTPGPAPPLTLFDESNPFAGLNSALGASVLERPDASTASSSAPSQRALDASASLLAGGDASSRTMSASTSVSASDTFLLQGSLAGGAHPGAPSFGGQSFAELSALQPRSMRTPQAQRFGNNAEPNRPVEVAGSRANLSSSTALGTATPRAPSALSAPLSSAPAVPSPLRFEAPQDLSMASSAADESHEVAQPVDSSPDASLRLIDFSSPPPASPVRPVAASSAVPSSPLRTSRTSPPPPPATPSSPAAAPPAPAPGLAGSSSSFYRQFMAARARDGLSQSARDEWSRLERGEKASPKDGSRVEAGEEEGEVSEVEQEELEEVREATGEAGDRTEASVYYSPQREWHDEREAAEADAGRSAYVDDVVEHEAVLVAESSIVELEEVRAAFLSPIVEVTEPESNANTPFEPVASTSRARARDPPPTQPSFAASLSSSLAAVTSSSTHAIPTPATPSRAQARRAPATPQSASRIPRPRNPVTPSQNPFLLQLARTSSSSIQPQAVTLLQDLFSTQQDQLAASSSQRFLLSSLVTNLQNEVEYKDAVIRTLKEQVGETRSELKEVEQLALAWEERALRSGPSAAAATAPPPPSARKTSAALEETVQLLADELETRVREDRALRDDLEAELARARADLARKVHDVRDGEIRLRHAHAALEQADDERAAMKREVERGDERRAEVVRERDELRSRWAIDVEQREQALARLRDEVHELRALGESGRGLDDEAVEREVQRRVEAAQADAQREAQLVRHELVQRDAALADLRDQLRAQRDESDRLGRAVQEERQHAELAHADMADTLAAKENELDEVLREHDALQQDLDEACARIEAAELERDRLAEAARAKDGELAEQVSQCQTALAAMADLEAAVVRIEAEAAAKEAQLAQVHKQLASARRESADVLEKRDRVLAESEKQAGRTRKELEALQKENNRLNDLVGKLRRDSADREVKVTKLKKRTAELEEDVFGLNIALDAKQQEAQHWKRQMSTIKLERESAAAAAAAESSYTSRSTLAPHVPSSAAPSTAKASRGTSISTRLHSTTPFPAEKQARRTSSSLSRRTSTTSTSTRRSSVVDPAVSTDDEEHDLTLPPTAYEQTPSRPAATTAGVRKAASTAHLGVGLGLPVSSRSRRTSAPQDREKENDAPVPVAARRREAVLA